MNLPALFSRPLVRHRVALAAILLAALALRVWGLDQHNIWWDEGLSAWAARLAVPRILDWTAHDVHPPLHFLIQRGWWLLAGEGEWAMRFISAAAGTLVVAAAYLLARVLGGRRAGLLAAAFLALSGFAVTWSQELRMYVWASLWALLALYGALRSWRLHDQSAPHMWRWLLLYVLAATAGLWTLYLFVIVLLVVNFAFLVFLARATRPRALFVRWALAQILVLLLFAPWLAYALPRMMSWSSSEPFSPAFFVRLYTTVLTTGIAENIESWLAPAILVLAVFLVALVALLRLHRSRLQSSGLIMLLLGVLLPGLIVYALTALPGRSFYVPRLAPRYFLPLAGTFYALLGWGLAELSRRARWAGLAGAGLVMAVAVSGLLTLLPGRVASDQYVSLVDTLRAHQHPGDKVLLYPDEDWPLFAARYPGAWEKVPAGMDLTPDNAPGLLGPIWESAEGLWVVQTPKAQEVDPEGLVRAWLDGRTQSHQEWDFGETRLAFYARTSARAATQWNVAPGHDPVFVTAHDVGRARVVAPKSPLRRYRTGDSLYVTLYWLNTPTLDLSLGLREAATPQAPLPPAPPVTEGPQRVVGRLTLTAGLKPGRYHVVLRDRDREAAALWTIEVVDGRSNQPANTLPQQPLDLRLGEHIRLLGYDLSQGPVWPGDSVSLTLYWRTDAALTERYKVFTHLIGAVWNAEQGNFLWGQQDNEPQAEQLPTTRWAPGEVIVDRYRVKLDPHAPPGNYQIEVGMYGLLDGARLRFQDGRDALILGQVEVRP